MTQEQLAMLLGVSRQSVTKWEAEKSYPEMDKLLKMCSIFECSLDNLVTGDLTNRPAEDATAPKMPGGPATDVCGYDDHAKSLAWRIPTGISFIMLGIAWTIFVDGGPTGILHEGDLLAVAGLFAGIVAGMAVLIPAGMRHSAFVKSHPYIEDFYTEEEKAKARKQLGAGIVVGIADAFLGILAMIATDNGAYENLGGAVMMLLFACAVLIIVNKGMLYARLNLAEYNKNAIDELEVEDIVKAAIDEQRKKTLLAAHGVKTRKERITGSLCGAIMIIATIAGLVMLFQPIAQGMDPDDVNWTANMFWMAWVIGGLCCGIVALLVNAFVEDE